VPRLPISKWSAIVRDIASVVISYCKRHVVKGSVRVEQVEGGVEVVVFIEQHGPMAHHGSSSGSTARESGEPRAE
jgi:hypothetical protein